MFPSLVRLVYRTTYRGAKGSGPGSSTRSPAISSIQSRNTFRPAQEAGRIFKRSQRGLFDGRERQRGNNVPKSKKKTLRTWLPNVQHNNLWSETMGRHFRAKTTTSALRSIDKAGGLDYYLANTNEKKLGAWGRDLRDKLALALREKRLKALSERGSTPLTPSPQSSNRQVT